MEKRDIKISGSGQIAAGVYNDVRVSGSAKLSGHIGCRSLHVSGSANAEGFLECTEELKVSGSMNCEDKVKAMCIGISGAFAAGDKITAMDMKCSGAFSCGGAVEVHNTLEISGKAEVTGDIEAERVAVSGRLNCGGLLNAEEIKICIAAGMDIGSIGGSRISIYRDGGKRIMRLPLFSSLVGSGKVHISGSIEGDNIAIENVRAPRVSGRVVAIGEDCEIDLVQYSENVEISPKAKVGSVEKV